MVFRNGSSGFEVLKLAEWACAIEDHYSKLAGRHQPMDIDWAKDGVTGEHLLKLLECRLDNVVYRLGFSASRKEARQLINHGHLMVNGRKSDVPAMLVKANDVIEVRERSRSLIPIQAALEAVDGRGIPNWLELDKGAFKGTVRSLPTKDDIALPVNEQMVVELYSR